MLITTDARKHARTHAHLATTPLITLFITSIHTKTMEKSGNRVAPVHCLPDDFRPLVGGEGV